MAPIISCVIPTYNEEALIAETLSEVSSKLDDITENYEIVVIDDGSTDGTPALVARLAAGNDRIRTYSFSRNFGKEAAIYAGLNKARGRAVIVMDADLQHPPDLIPEMVSLWSSGGYQVVEAVKVSRGDISRIRGWFSKTFYSIFRAVSGYDLQNSSDFKLLDREVVQALLAMPEKSRFFRGLVHWVGFRRVSIAFDVEPRAAGGSRWQFLQLASFAFDALAAFSAVPLRIVTVFGGLLFLWSVLFGAYVLLRWATGTSLSGFPTVILLQLGIGSILMLGLGIIGEYLYRIYIEVKRRQIYILKSETDEGKQDASE
jgi:glycosyltransferase involved in cell wall biosynthesis